MEGEWVAVVCVNVCEVARLWTKAMCSFLGGKFPALCLDALTLISYQCPHLQQNAENPHSAHEHSTLALQQQPLQEQLLLTLCPLLQVRSKELADTTPFNTML